MLLPSVMLGEGPNHDEVVHWNLGDHLRARCDRAILRLAQGWQVQVGDMGVAMSVSWVALAVSLILTVWGVALLRRS